MTEHIADSACVEGGDIPGDRPLRVICFGSNFATLDDREAMGFTASGPNCVQTLAATLLQAGYDADRQLVLFRGGERVGRTTIGKAVQRDR